jgi:4-carboxymuconolactone decarboxylase
MLEELIAKETYPVVLDLAEVTLVDREAVTLTKRERRVIILSVGSVWKAAYEIYSQSARVREVGAEIAIVALAAGGNSDAPTEREKLAHRFTYRLITTYAIDDFLYSEIPKAFGERGIVDICYLISRYLLVSCLLRTFEVAAPG